MIVVVCSPKAIEFALTKLATKGISRPDRFSWTTNDVIVK